MARIGLSGSDVFQEMLLDLESLRANITSHEHDAASATIKSYAHIA